MNSRALALALVVFAARTASAQTPQTPQTPSQGPMIVERIQSGFLFAPDVKVTEVDRKTSELAGGYAGWVADEALFVGDRKSTRLNSSHVSISYAVFCLKKKKLTLIGLINMLLVMLSSAAIS